MSTSRTEVAITPNRVTSLVLDTPVYDTGRGRITVQRRADQMNVQAHPARPSVDVQLIAERTWLLKQRLSSWDGGALALGDFLTLAQGNTPPTASLYFEQRTPTDLNGVTAPGHLPQSFPVIKKVVAAGSSWSQALDADEAAFPRPTLSSETVPMNRVFSGNVTYPANAAFTFYFHIPTGAAGFDYLYTFYFGGPSDANFIPGQEAPSAGCFAVSFRGDGQAWLFARMDPGPGEGWYQIFDFRYSASTRALAGWHWVTVTPYRNNRILFRSLQAESAPEGGGLFDAFKLGSRAQPINTSIYKHSARLTGCAFLTSICGAGYARVDAREDLAYRFGIARQKFKSSGTLYDLPFVLPRVVPTDTVLKLSADFEAPPNTELTGSIYRDDTGSVLSAGPNVGEFLTPESVQEYFVRYDFSTSDGTSSPAFRSYTVEIDEAIALSALTPQTGGSLMTISSTSQDVDPSHDTAALLIKDLGGELTKLRGRARIPAQIRCQVTPALYSILFEGEVARATAGVVKSERSIADAWPNAYYYTYDTLLVGRWARLFDKVAISPFNFAKDYDAAPDDQGVYPPWRIRDIIAKLFKQAGVPNEQLDLPESELRLFPSPDGLPYLLPVTNTRYAACIWELARKYLDWFIVWDPNAGARGLWRGLAAPQNPYIGSFLWDFVLGPGAGIGPPHVAGMYTTSQTFIRAGTYQTWRQAPEANHVQVWGSGERVGDTQFRLQAELMNYASYSPNPAVPTATDEDHLDYLGFELPLIYPDPAIRTREAAEFICRRLYDASAHGREWASWTSPYVLLINELDVEQAHPRPLRLGDVVRLDGRFAMIRSCTLEIDGASGGDDFMWGQYQAVFLD